MRTILEELPFALFPDLQKESDDPGVKSDLLDDDLVRPAAEDELPRSTARGRKSPLSRHMVHAVDPLDRSLPLPIGLTLSLEGARVTEVTLDTGFTHQALERRCLGRPVIATRQGGAGADDDVTALFRVVARAEPGVVSAFALARAIERLAGVTPSPSTTLQRQMALDLCTIVESARVLAQPALGADVGLARAAWRSSAALLEALCADDVFFAAFRLRRPLAREELSALLRLLDDVAVPWGRLDPRRAYAHLEGTGLLNARTCRELGVQGPALRAAGAVDDTPTIDLEAAKPAATLELIGDAWSRLVVRYADASDALARLRERLRRSLDAPAITGEPSEAAGALDDGIRDGICDGTLNGIGTAQVRGPSGACAILIAVAGGKLERLRLRPPDLALIAALPRALVDVDLDDVAAVIASFGINPSAVDR